MCLHIDHYLNRIDHRSDRSPEKQLGIKEHILLLHICFSDQQLFVVNSSPLISSWEQKVCEKRHFFTEKSMREITAFSGTTLNCKIVNVMWPKKIPTTRLPSELYGFLLVPVVLHCCWLCPQSLMSCCSPDILYIDEMNAGPGCKDGLHKGL